MLKSKKEVDLGGGVLGDQVLRFAPQYPSHQEGPSGAMEREGDPSVLLAP
jgi:hypothetical protein